VTVVLEVVIVGVVAGGAVVAGREDDVGADPATALLGGKVVFADVDPETLNLDPADAAARVTERTVGIIGVHLYGRPFDVDALLDLCQKRGLWLLEDAAQAHGAEWKGRKVGGFGQLAAWSFYPTKNLGCFGDGGAATGNDRQLVERVRSLGNHGQSVRYTHMEIGTNSRLDALQAAVLDAKARHLTAQSRDFGDKRLWVGTDDPLIHD